MIDGLVRLLYRGGEGLLGFTEFPALTICCWSMAKPRRAMEGRCSGLCRCSACSSLSVSSESSNCDFHCDASVSPALPTKSIDSFYRESFVFPLKNNHGYGIKRG